MQKAMKREISHNNNEELNRLYESKANADGNLFDTMMQETDPIGGKRLFRDRVNISDAGNMHPVETDISVLRNMNEPKSNLDYADKSKIIYEAPPVVKTFKDRHSFVHN
jgi:hypothetical protein